MRVQLDPIVSRCESESSWEDSEDDDYEPEEERA